MTIDLESLVRRAGAGDVDAFVALTQRFQHFAFGSALALVGDFQQAEDVVQEAFLAAWTGLPRLAEPAAFPGWLRGIVRHQAFRALRRRGAPTVPLNDAEAVASEAPAADDVAAARQHAAAALAAIAQLPAVLREPATLFYVHECSHQDIATFLGLTVTTVNNRLHAARAQLKHRMVAMVKHMLEAHALPDAFATRIGRLVAARGDIVEALFDPAAPPDLLSELTVSDEANKRAVTVQVIQRPGGGIVRAVVTSTTDTLARGSTVLHAGRHSEVPLSPAVLERIVPALVGNAQAGHGKIVETGIKAIDVLCPLGDGGSVAIAGEFGSGITVVMEEMVRRLRANEVQLSLFILVPPRPWSQNPDFSHAEELRKDGCSEGTLGGVQAFFLRTEDGPWTADRLATLAPIDVVIHLSRAQAVAGIYPCVEPLTSRSRWLVGDEALLVQRVRDAVAAVRAAGDAGCAGADVGLDRARKLSAYFGQPFFFAEFYTRRPGIFVARGEALEDCRAILDGEHDDLPLDAFRFTGRVAEIRARARAGFTPYQPPPRAEDKTA
jgi:RNA polymerase sigma-70 factor (ECF subfamily)